MMEFTFEETPWALALQGMKPGDTLAAARFLTLLEGESEEMVEEAFLDLEMGRITLDISQLPKPVYMGQTAVQLRREEELVRQNADLLTVLEENDPLRLYLEEVAGLPAAGDVQLMAERFAGGYDPVLPGLTNLMLSTVIEMAKEHTGRGVLLLDLIQEGSLGLWQGILSFRSGEFEPHARWWIAQYLAKAVTLQAREMGLGQKLKRELDDYRQVDEQLLTDLGRNPTLEEIADRLHISPEEAQTVASMLESARTLQQAHAAAEPKEETPEDEQHVEDTAYFQSRQRIAEMLSDLTDTQAKLLELRFGLEGGKPLSPEEAGRRLGLTPEEVIQMETEALAKLRRDNK